MKKVISVLISVCIMLSMFTFVGITASAETTYTSGDYTYYISNGKAVIEKYNGSATSLTIPSTLGGYSVTGIGVYAFYGCKSLTSVTIPDSVTSIDESAFDGCTSLTSINVNSNNKNYCDIKGVLFNKDKTKLIRYPQGKTTTSYTIPDSVTSIGYAAFYNCTSLTSVTIPNSVTRIYRGVFSGCKSLISITIPDSVTSIDDQAFYCCESLTSVTIPNSVTSIGWYAFYGCTSLTSITIPDSVTSIGNYAFSGCTSLTSVIMGNNVKSIGEKAFYNCKNITKIFIPKSINEIGNNAFLGTDRLKGIYYGDIEKRFKAIYSTWNDDLYYSNIHYESTRCDAYGHQSKNVIVKKATYTENGLYNQVCSVCGEVLGKGYVIAKLQKAVPAIKSKVSVPAVKIKTAKKKITIKYKKVKNAVGFQVRYKIKGKWIVKTFNTKKSATKTIKNLKKGKYKVQVRAFVKQDGKIIYSGWTKTKTVKVK